MTMSDYKPSVPRGIFATAFVIYLMTTCLPQCLLASVPQALCNSEQFRASCDADEILVIDSALFGRMEDGRCGVTSLVGHIGCRNDVMFLVDEKCSGRRECQFIVGSKEFFDANKECPKELYAYLSISYSCVKVVFYDFAQCLSLSRAEVSSAEGFISSHVTDETGCGSRNKAWSLSAQPGQTIDLSILDFSALSRHSTSQLLACRVPFGYIAERSVNQSFCPGLERQRHLYTSKTHLMEISVTSQTERGDDSRFLIHYRVSGCSDLTPPGHAWYERDGQTAVIGCQDSGIKWELTCRDNTWHGVVGNCSAHPVASADSDQSLMIGSLSVNSMLAVAAIVGATIVLAIIIIVAGIICVKKYRHESESRMGSTAGTLVYRTQPHIPGQASTREQYRAMTVQTMRKPCSSTMGSVHHACTMPSRPQYPSLAASCLQYRTDKAPAPPPPSANHAPPSSHTLIPSSHSLMPFSHAQQWIVPVQTHPAPRLVGTHTGLPSGTRRRPSWCSDHGTMEGEYQNPDEVLGTACAPSTRIPACAPSTRVPALTDPDDVSSYYAPNTGHKYFILERQPEPGNSTS